MIALRFIIFALLAIASTIQSHDVPDTVVEEFVSGVNNRLADLYNKQQEHSWLEEITETTEKNENAKDPIFDTMDYINSIASQVSKLKRAKITKPELRRQLDQVPNPGYDVLDDPEQMQLHEVVANMSDIYKTVHLCAYKDPNNCTLRLVPEMQEILQSSSDVEEIKYYWLEWREKTGLKSKNAFRMFTELYTKTAALNGYKSPMDFWLRDIEGDSIEIVATLDKILTDLRPMFLQFHAFVRSTLRLKYGPELIPFDAPYPQHLAEIFIGNSYRDMSGDWKLELPYPEVGLPNITAGLLGSGITSPKLLFKTAAKYYESIGMPAIPGNFWEESAKPKSDVDERLMTCWSKTWKFYGTERINFSYCPMPDEERYTNMFEALTDYYYYQSYKDLPTLFQEEPLPNFADAIGKVFSLAATSPRFLEKNGFTKPGFDSYEGRINRLYLHGLRNVFLIPIFYILDKYRLGVLENKIKNLDNCAYWELTEQFTGATSPVRRSSAEFDAPSKLLLEVDDQYSSPIMSIILEFQIFKSFCERTGQYKKGDPNYPLDLCDLSGQRDIGPVLTHSMSLGSSRSWKEVLFTMTGESELDVTGFLEFFSPLYVWLESINQVNQEKVGWVESKNCV